ncbi:MAG: hypothetical protein ISR62_03735 [Desulfobacteraceae bacterium]|nr:hypothetical protein [Desulfobacterales bacterium]MBL6967514.1 hypothetical protein [Desulfobacteraceae bacterium]MBL7101491.1 hypothetical protein [Desulfobacteraceae bacterium]MBL7172676.1 hypothetical protein [Desulfobacteraceae bacterium]MBU0735201.1 hypothetical protein [Pseudomonadota bacterium]
MNNKGDQKAKFVQNDLISCSLCHHFSYFDNDDEHNSPHALGKCEIESWDGNRGQWAKFQHHCRNFVKAAPG